MLLEGKRLLITGVLNDASIAFSVAREAQNQGAEVTLTSFGRAMSLTQRAAKRLPTEPHIVELDVTNNDHLSNLASEIDGQIDGVLHAIAFAPETCLGGGFIDAPWEDVATAFHISTYSFVSLARACLPLMKERGGSIVGMDFDASVAWPVYDWMGVCKAGLESAARYLARDLGKQNIRVNLVAAGPLKTIAARSIPGFDAFESLWGGHAPLGWELKDLEPVAKACVALFSDSFPATTGEIIHVDGGFHAVGM